MSLEALKKEVYEANMELVEKQLVISTWGNVSGYDEESGLMVIKPSGVPYKELRPDQMVPVDLNGNVVDSDYVPSTDTDTHIELYKAFKDQGIRGIVHTHSQFATMWAQMGKNIPCYGTTHCDYFFGDIPCTRLMTTEEIEEAYEKNTGKVILEEFEKRNCVEMQFWYTAMRRLPGARLRTLQCCTRRFWSMWQKWQFLTRLRQAESAS